MPTTNTSVQMTLRFFPNDKANPPSKLADAEIHFVGAPLAGSNSSASPCGSARPAAAT